MTLACREGWYRFELGCFLSTLDGVRLTPPDQVDVLFRNAIEQPCGYPISVTTEG
jgi:hypothetical protein